MWSWQGLTEDESGTTGDGTGEAASTVTVVAANWLVEAEG